MSLVYFIHGLALFCLGLVVLLEARRASTLALSRHLPWLACFGLIQALVAWCDMLLLSGLPAGWPAVLVPLRSALLPISAVLLVRFGVGLVSEAGPLPAWLMLAPIALVVPLALVVGYALIVAVTEPPLALAAEVWSRSLLYGPGCLAAAVGLLRQALRLPPLGLANARPLLVGAALAFAFDAVVAGLLVPPAPYGLASFINSDLALNLSGWPVPVWRALSALAVTVLMVRAMGVFEAERIQRWERLQADRDRALDATLQAQSRARETAEHWTNTLVEINRSVANIDEVEAVLPAIVQAAARLLDAQAAGLALWNADGSRLEATCTVAGDALTGAASQALDDPLLIRVARSGQPLRLPAEEQVGWHCPAAGAIVRSASLVPLSLDQHTLGVLWVSRQAEEPFGPADEAGLGHLADQAVITLEHTLMAARLQSLAVVEERGRIAREMHDGLSQVLGYLSLQLQTLEALVRRGDCDSALAALHQARGHIREAQADVRENILSLRTTLAGQTGLVPALEQYVEEFGVQTGIRAALKSELAGEASLSPLAEAQLMRIAQEALSNVRKHAQAQQVQVGLRLADRGLLLVIADDGRGFCPETVAHGHFGLQTMRERAESVGGWLAVDSGLGGTRLEAWLPRVPAG